VKSVLYSLNTVFNIMEIIEWNLKFYEEKDSRADCICINIFFFPLLSYGQNFVLHVINIKCENSVCCHYHTFILSVLQIEKVAVLIGSFYCFPQIMCS
jgi:hypothetical protein